MNQCQQIQERLDAYVDGESDPQTTGRVEAHLAACQVCQAELKSLRRLVVSTGQLFTGSGAPEGFEAAVMAVIGNESRGGAGVMAERGLRAPHWFGEWVGSLRGAGGPWTPLRWSQLRWTPLTWTPLGMVALASLLLLSTLCGGKIRPSVGRRQTLVMVSRCLAWNSRTWLGIQAYADGDSNQPLSGAPVHVQVRRAAAGPWVTLYEGQTDSNGNVDAWFRLPPELLGACEVRVQTGDGWMPDRVVRPVTISRHGKVLKC